MLNKIFSTCNSTLPSVNLTGMRIGYATNWWANLGPEVRHYCNEAYAVPPAMLYGSWTPCIRL